MATQTVTVSRAPANGASQSTGMPAAGAVDYSMTDLDLLETPEAAAEAAADDAATTRPAGQGGKGTAESSQAQKDAAANSPEKPAVPPEFERAFELPEIGSKLREICERDAQYRQIFPDAGAARAAAAAQADLARLDRMVESRDPRVHAELLAGLQRLAPQAFRDLALTLAQQLAVLDPAAYRQVAAAMAAQAGVPQRSLSAQPGVAAPPQPDLPRDAPPVSGPAGTAVAANQFLESVNTGVEQAVQSSIAAKVAELLPDAPAGARQKISGEIFRELDQTLRQDPELLGQVRESIHYALRAMPGAANAPQREALSRLISGRAQAALPAVAKRVVADWSETVLRSSQQRRARQSESASRVEVGRGGAPGPVPLRPRGVDYARMSDEEILNMD